MEVQTVTEAFVSWLQTENIATLNEDLYISQVPDTAPDTTYWIVTAGGSPISKLGTGEQIKQYFLSVYYRSLSSRDVGRKLFRLEELLNCASCVELPNYEVYEISAQQFPTDTDVDNEERRVGFLQANIKIYKKEC